MNLFALLIPVIVILAGLILVINVSRLKKSAATPRERIVKSVKTQSGIIFLLSGSFTLYQVYAGQISGVSAAFGAILLICLFLLPVGLLTGGGVVLFGNWMDALRNKAQPSKKE